MKRWRAEKGKTYFYISYDVKVGEAIEDFDKFLGILEREEYYIEEVPVYEVRYKDDNKIKTEYFINDFVVERETTRVLHMGIKTLALRF